MVSEWRMKSVKSDFTLYKNIRTGRWKFDYVFVFIAVFLCNLCCRESSMPIKIFPDHFGMISSAAKFAGYSWSEVLQLSSYYGPGFYILIIPLLKLIHDPIILYNLIIDLDYLIIAICAVLLHHIICDELEYKKRWTSAIVVCVATIVSIHISIITFSNESPSLLILLLVIILYIKFIKSTKRWHRALCCFFSIVLEVYAMMIHVRNIVIVLVTVLLWIMWIAYNLNNNIIKKRIYLFIPVIIGIVGYFGYKSIPAFFKSMFFTVETAGNQEIRIINTQIATYDAVKGTFDILFGNILASIKQTYGIVVISYFLIIKAFVVYFKCLKDRKEVENLKICKFLCFSFSAGCFLVGLAGTAVNWMGNMRGTGYWRYYGTYAAPMLAISFLYVMDNVQKTQVKTKILVTIAYFFLIKDFLYILYPRLGKYFDFWFVYPYMQGGKNTMHAFLFMAMVSFVGIMILLSNIKDKKIYVYCVFFALFYIVPQLKGGNLFSYTVNDYCNVGYRIINELDEQGIIDKRYDLYFVGDDYPYMYYQYMMLENGITRNIPDQNDEILVFSNRDNVNGIISGKGWSGIQLDENEYVYSKDKGLLNDVEKILEGLKYE